MLYQQFIGEMVNFLRVQRVDTAESVHQELTQDRVDIFLDNIWIPSNRDDARSIEPCLQSSDIMLFGLVPQINT